VAGWEQLVEDPETEYRSALTVVMHEKRTKTPDNFLSR
jgi:hypothetical protein